MKKRYIWFSITSLLIVCIIWFRLASGAVPFIDQWTIPYAKQIESSSFIYQFFEQVTHLGSRFFLVPFTILLSIPFYLLFRSMKPWLVLSGGTLSVHLLNMGIKAIVQRDRPQIVADLAAEGFSFPSGHAMISFAFYSLLMYFLYKRMSEKWIRMVILFVGSLLILFIGTSRYFLYVHYVSDIVAGYLIGFVLTLVIIHFSERYQIGKTR